MKNYIKKPIAICIFIIFIILNNTFIYSKTLEKINKDETVYVVLENNGVVSKMSIVNRFQDINSDKLVDYGFYNNISPLRKINNPEIDNGKITWNTSNYKENDFYYEGELYKQIPININIEYYHNKQIIESSKLAGKSGEFEIKLDIEQNKKIATEYKNIFITQIQLRVDLDNIKILDSKWAAKTITGKYATLSYNIMPDEDKTYKLLLSSNNFTIEPITIILLRYDIDYSEYKEMLDGINEMTEGVKELTDGGKKLEYGISDLSKGINQINNGTINLYNGFNNYKSGLKSYKNSLNQYEAGLNNAANGIKEFNSGFSALVDNSTKTENGYTEIQTNLNNIVLGGAELTELANTLIESEDPNVKKLAEGLIAQNLALENLNNGFKELNTNYKILNKGFNESAKGFNTITSEFSKLKKGFNELNSGFDYLNTGYNTIFGGFCEYKSGVYTLNKEVNVLPSEVNKLNSGQEDLYNGINTFNKEMVEAFSKDKKSPPIISFADSSKEIHSLQFIMKTGEITNPEPKSSDINDSTEKNLNSFEKIWDKLTNLF